MSSWVWITIGIAAVLAAILLWNAPMEPSATAEVTSPPPSHEVPSPSGRAPVVEAGEDRVVIERESVRLTGEGYDPDGGPVVYHWTAEGGVGLFEDANHPVTIYTAPSVCTCEDTVCLTLTVTNAAGVSARDRLILTVRDPLACPASAGGTTGSSTVVSSPSSCETIPPPCPKHPEQACASPCIVEVPLSGRCSEIPVACSCGDPCGWTWEGGWPFGSQPEHPRDRAKARIDRHYPAHLAEETAISIRGYVENPACVSVCFTWTVSKGRLEGAETLQPVYHAPESHRVGGEPVTITFSVYDTSGFRSYDQIRIHIDNISGPGS